uniref:Membrane insertase YidC/Oxa/ALB C-terminal domain-containing protein n=1 Tax=Panagrolaimus superbus TaxID=310955 RepID=A0A914Y336_9BILA
MLSLPLRSSRATCYKTSKLVLFTSQNIASPSSTLTNFKLIQSRNFSSKDVFGASSNFTDIPAPPLPAPPMPSIEELAASGQSVLDELGLFTWWKPTSYFRWALEALHVHFDLPWWGAIVAGTIVLRVALIYVPIMSQKLVAKQSKYKPELDEFKDRMQDAKAEGNHLAMQHVLLEQQSFMKERDIKIGRQFLVMFANGGVFMTQFFAIRKMIQANYPGWSDGGTLWFNDLTATDPYFLLPIISAGTLAYVLRLGVETGASSDQLTPGIQLLMQYGIPVIVLISSTQFGSGLCVYWVTSNIISLVYAGMFKNAAIRNVFGIPPVIKWPTKAEKASAWRVALKQYKANRNAAPSISDIRQRDADLFKKAGRAKPINK